MVPPKVIIPPLACLPRSPVNLAAVLDGLMVKATKKYQPEDFPGVGIRTKCNYFVEDACEQLGAHIPKGLLARQQIAWLKSPAGRNEGWFEMLRRAADKYADEGRPVLVGWLNPDVKRSSHIAMMRSAGRIAQAGASNFADGTIGAGFGTRVVSFWGHL